LKSPSEPRPAQAAAEPTEGARPWRLEATRRLLLAARGLEFFSLAIPRPDDLIGSAHRFYAKPEVVTGMAESADADLYPHEKAALERFAPHPTDALVLGCGAGREAIALVKRGWSVVGLDAGPALIEAAKLNAARADVRIDFRCHDITRPFHVDVDRVFDLVCIFGVVYSLIPSRPLRVATLRTCRTHLAPDGVCVLDFAARENPTSPRELWAHRWRQRLAWATRGNRDCQIGDHWFAGVLCMHAFAHPDEVSKEAEEAGFHTEMLRDPGYPPVAVLTHRPHPHEMSSRDAD